MNTRPAARSFLAVPMLLCAFGAGARGADPRPQAVTLTTGDDAELSARYFPGDGGRKSPAVIVLDDLGDRSRPEACDALARALVKDGCTVICFDFRGHGKSVEVAPEFWDHPTNRQLVTGFKAANPPEKIRHTDFKPGYLPTLVNDVASARAYLERRNDASECNTGRVYVIGFGRGATVGQIWAAAEWSRYRSIGLQGKLAPKPEGVTLAGFVWVNPQLMLDRQTVPMLDLMKRTQPKKGALIGLLNDEGDAEATKFAQQCGDAFNTKSSGKLVAIGTLSSDGQSSVARRDAESDRIAKFLTNMRKVQELPPWDDRRFVDRRFVWALPVNAPVLAKDEGDDRLQPVPIDQLLGKR